MDEEVSRLEDCLVIRMRTYVPALVFGAFAQTRERREYVAEAVMGIVTLRRMAIRKLKDSMIISHVKRRDLSLRVCTGSN